ncbi:Autophagy protein 7 [Coemansia sp. RSA 1933]|nr:Autophagy protein 7 [Coemansia sp. RSA 1933]
MPEILRFEPFASTIEPEFWAGLAQHKLHSAQLDTARTAVRGEYAGGRRHALRGGASEEAQRLAVPARLRISQDAWGSSSNNIGAKTERVDDKVVGVEGFVYNTNTVEEFKRRDKGELLREAGAAVLEAVRSGRATRVPELLWPFALLSYADLKKYRFYHWAAFPAVTADPPDTSGDVVPISDFVRAEHDLDALHNAFATFAHERPHSHGAFIAVYKRSGLWSVQGLEDWEQAFGSDADGSTVMLGFIDPSSHATRPGWPLRNLLTWVRHVHPEAAHLKVLCFRDAALQGERRRLSESLVIDVNVTPVVALKAEDQVSGWERNEKQRLAPRVADLSAAMDPAKLAESALDLNLQLMRWRLAPSVDLVRMAATRVLLVGAGTLGAYAARALLAWGVRKITFVDSGRVSFSNPARQPLYDFADSLAGGKPKAAAAADAMRRIFPGVDAQGEQLSIPMPGHPVPPAEIAAAEAAVAKLDRLVADHDTVFLLTDSRESRWLPAMLGALHRKTVVCVALGFDSFVAMRHGVSPDANAPPDAHQLGCYFCNDVVAPTDSLTDRTLDQQCTVTRPGLAPIAAGIAVELLASVVQHPLGAHAPPPLDSDSSDDAAVFGTPAHQIRGYLSGFRQHAIVGHASSLCTACSPAVLDAYRTHGFAFLLRAFNNVLVDESSPHTPLDASADVPAAYSYLETLTGLAALHRQTDAIIDDIEWSDDEGGLGASDDDNDDDFVPL